MFGSVPVPGRTPLAPRGPSPEYTQHGDVLAGQHMKGRVQIDRLYRGLRTSSAGQSPSPEPTCPGRLVGLVPALRLAESTALHGLRERCREPGVGGQRPPEHGGREVDDRSSRAHVSCCLLADEEGSEKVDAEHLLEGGQIEVGQRRSRRPSCPAGRREATPRPGCETAPAPTPGGVSRRL